MRATVMYGAGDVRVEDVPDARLIEPTDALVRVTRAAICGSDLWPYKSMPHDDAGRRMGHEFIGVVDAVGSDVVTVKVGDLVVSPFLWSDGSCVFCREGLQSACLHGGRYGFADIDGGQGEAVRVPQADGTLVVLPVDEDDALMPSLLTLSDVMGTGHHAALAAQVGPGKTVAVVGDGAVGLCGVIASKRLGAERIILLGKNPERIALGQEFGATDIVRERGDDAVERVRELTEHGAHSVLECVGLEQAVETALAIARPGGAIGRVGVPEHDSTPTGVAFWKNAAMGGGPAPGPRLHRRTAPGRARGPHRTGSRVRPHRLDRRRAGRLPSDERPRSPQVPDQALSKERFMTMTIPTLTLNSGVELPALGFGVFQTPPDETVAAVEAALAVGYRHIDTAAAYGNEREVGEAIRRSGIDRSDVFIETKVWISDFGYDETLHAFEKSAAKLGVEQIDLLILHQPLPSEFERSRRTRRSRSSSPTARCGQSASATSCPTTSSRCWSRRMSFPRSTRSSCTRTSPRSRHANSMRGTGS
jgi:threonine dehydrogenase-like Zn-dependent dehydrogenase